MKHVVGQQSLFDDVVFVEEAKPAKKREYKPKANVYRFQCNLGDRYVVVYAQHPGHAFRKCQGVHGYCIGRPVQLD